MSISSNEIFKFVSLRRPLDGLTIDPVADIPESQVVKLINHSGIEAIDPSNLDPKILDLIHNIPILSEDLLNGMRLSVIERSFHGKERLSYSILSSLKLDFNDTSLTLAQFSNTTEFANDYTRITDSWLVLAFNQYNDSLVHMHERIIRIAHICLRLRTQPNTVKNSEVIEKLRRARIVLPRKWRRGFHQKQTLLARHTQYLENLEAPIQSRYEKELERKKTDFSTLSKKIHNLESIQSKAYYVYTQYKAEAQVIAQDESAPEREKPIASHPREFRRGSIARSGVHPDGLDDRYDNHHESQTEKKDSEGRVPTAIVHTTKLDDRYYASLEGRMNDDEKLAFTEVFELVPQWPNTLHTVLTTIEFELNNVVNHANTLCQEIEEEKPWTTLPIGERRDVSDCQPSVRALGMGELVVAREHLVNYDAREIAHIENILGGEKKLREHERTKITEEFFETETVNETESEKDLQSSDRYELQRESQKTIEQDFSIDVGVDTSGRYGLTKIDTFSDISFSRSKSESSSNSVQLAKEIVSKAVERTFESVRRLERITTTEQFRELNTHSVENISPEGSTEIPAARSGIYLWVEKIHEIELRHYGTRLMIEFYVPEPAVSLLEGGMPKNKMSLPKPPPFNISPTDVTQDKYLCLTKQFGAEDIEPPPALFTKVGWAWSSTPNESDNENTSEDTVGHVISIPPNYIPISGVALVSSHPASEDGLYMFLGVAGHKVIELKADKKSDKKGFDVDSEYQWHNGVPVTVLAHGHFDKTLTAQITILCRRSPEALTSWKLRTWEKLHEAHRILMREYERAVEEQEFNNVELFQTQSRPAIENRRIEREELTKWCVKAMRYPNQFTFDAIESVAGYQETAPLDADAHAPIVMFFEDAFEWQQMSYFFYPYFWGRRETWRLRQNLSNVDSRHSAFLRAGAARVVVPVTPGYETRVMNYLDLKGKSELERITSPVPTEVDGITTDSDAEDLWLELLTNFKEDLAIGQGTLAVERGNNLVKINTDNTEYAWQVRDRDLGRELYINGYQFTVASLVFDNPYQFYLNKPYEGETNTSAIYAAGSVPYGPPWLVRLPTNLVVLTERKENLNT